MPNQNFSGELDEVSSGLSLLMKESLLKERNHCLNFTVHKNTEPGFQINVNGSDALIEYHEKSDFFRALSFAAQHAGEEEFQLEEAPCFEKTGVMIDCSRNAVPTVDSIKSILRKMALMGLNLGMLYTEDTYEVKSRPYFGYMRGRYTFEELKELDDYADALGIELIPCIQTLAHLERALQWPAMDYLRDSERNLMVGEDSTYDFIEEMITSASAPFRSNRIHIGMDEAWELGLGRYLSKNGYRPCGELMKEHLERVNAILKKHSLHAMMWSDMHFVAASPTRDLYDPNCVFTPELLAGAPENIDLVYWDYYHETEAHYEKLLRMHQQFPAKTVFAGGIWTWIGPAADYSKTLKATLPALAQCKNLGIQEVIATAWGDDGAEANLQSILFGLQVYAEYRYTGEYSDENVNARFSACCGADGQAFLDLSLFNQIPGVERQKESTLTPAKTLLFEDPLIPLFEEDFRGTPCAGHFRALAERFQQHSTKNPQYALLLNFYTSFAEAVYQKCLWRDRSADCIRRSDRTGAGELLKVADDCIGALKALKEAWSKLWYTTNKPNGFEVIDIRLSGLIGRFDTAKDRMAQFASGELNTIPELAEPKLPYLRDENGTYRCLNGWGPIATVCRIVG